MTPGLKLHQGHPAGRDPWEMTQDELIEAAHEPMPLLRPTGEHSLVCATEPSFFIVRRKELISPGIRLDKSSDQGRGYSTLDLREFAHFSFAKSIMARG